MTLNTSDQLATLQSFVPQMGLSAPRSERQRTLVVDDERMNRAMLCRILAHQGIDSVQAASGMEAIELLKREAFDLVLLDITMPEMDGFETLVSIRERLDESQLPVIMVTAANDRQHVIRAFDYGANDYLTKPIDAGITAARVKTQLKLLDARSQLRESQERYALAALGSRDGIWDWNLLTDRVYYSPRWKDMLGLPENYLANTPNAMMSRIHTDDLKHVEELLEKHLRGDTPHFETELRVRHEGNCYRWMLFRGIAVRDDSGAAQRVAGSLTDITEGKVADALTGLPNRLMFSEQVDRCFEKYRRDPSAKFCAMYLDLDNFKLVNDSHGHEAGDQLLITVSHRMSECVTGTDTVIARLGGDEFAALIQTIDSPDAPTELAARLLEAVQRPIRLPTGTDFHTGVSIGMSVVSDRCLGRDDLLREADTAMYQAKANGKNGYSIYDPGMHQRVRDRLAINSEIGLALEKNEFLLHFQPIFDTRTLAIIGAEILIRWDNPKRGLMAPLEFVPIAEESGMIIPIGRWVISETCRILGQWRQQHPEISLRVNINLSAKQFNDTELIDRFRTGISENAIHADQLGIEIKENFLLERTDRANEMLREFRSLGVRIAMDEFGTGYSSLANLRLYPLDSLKIDRSFVSDIHLETNAAIVRAIKGISEGLGLTLVAEGIETKEQEQILQNVGCYLGQGHYYCKSLPPDDFFDRYSASQANRDH